MLNFYYLRILRSSLLSVRVAITARVSFCVFLLIFYSFLTTVGKDVSSLMFTNITLGC